MKFANITTTAEIKEKDYAKKIALRKLQSMKPRGILRVCLCVDIYSPFNDIRRSKGCTACSRVHNAFWCPYVHRIQHFSQGCLCRHHQLSMKSSSNWD